MSASNSAARPPDTQKQNTKGYEISDNKVVQIGNRQADASVTHIEFGGYSTAGLKEENQDAFAVMRADVAVRKHKGSVAAIADGVSCSERSAEASQLSVTDFISDYYSTPDTWTVKDSAARVLNALNSWLYQHGNHGPTHSSELVTTFSSAIIRSHTVHIFHAGDSRIYCYRQGNLEQITRDHSRREGNNMVLTNALGLDTHLEVDYIQRELEAGDVFLMSTDGVHDFLSDRELKDLLQQDAVSLESLAQRMCNTALSKGSDDNLSALLLRVVSLPQNKPVETQRSTENYVIPPTMEEGMSIDGFRILEKLAAGEDRQRYLVEHQDTSTTLLLKAPRADYSDHDDYLEAFIREQWIGQRIDHSRVARVLARPAESQFIYTIYEYSPTQTLRQWMHDNPNPTLGTVRDIAEQIASGLRAFQRQGMMHRDMTPENVMIDADGRIKLTDFGTVQVSGLPDIKAIRQGKQSACYGAPEHIAAEKGSYRSDIFSLGILIYEMLSGDLPYQPLPAKRAGEKNSKPGKYRSIRLSRENIPVWIDAALKKATAYSPKDRYQALSELCHDLREPNQGLVNKLENAPLLERYPLLFWQVCSLALFVSLVWVAVQI